MTKASSKKYFLCVQKIYQNQGAEFQNGGLVSSSSHVLDDALTARRLAKRRMQRCPSRQNQRSSAKTTWPQYNRLSKFHTDTRAAFRLRGPMGLGQAEISTFGLDHPGRPKPIPTPKVPRLCRRKRPTSTSGQTTRPQAYSLSKCDCGRSATMQTCKE